MKLSSPIIKTALCLSMVVGGLGLGIHSASANFDHQPRCESKQICGSREGTRTYEINRDSFSYCPQRYEEVNHGPSKGKCKKKWGQGPEYINKVIVFKSCPQGWSEKSGDESKCVKVESCETRFCYNGEECQTQPTPTPSVEPTQEPSPEPTSIPESSPTPDDGQIRSSFQFSYRSS